MTAEEFLEIWHNDAQTVLCHTSGSTGIPKPIELTKHDMRMSASATNTFFGLGAGSRFVCPMSFDFIGARMMAVRADVCGGGLIAPVPSNRFDFDGRADLLAIVPSQVDHVLDTRSMTGRIGAVIIGGAPLDDVRRHRIVESGLNAWITYGMTETASHIALARVNADKQPTYRALPGVEMTTDERGCLVIDMPGRDNNHIVTNDIVRLVGTDCFEWIGRADNVINSGGLKIYPEEIEAIAAEVLRSAGVTFTAVQVRGEKDSKWGTAAVLYVEKPGNMPGTDKLLDAIGDRLADSRKAPRRIVIVERLPRTASGKLQRQGL